NDAPVITGTSVGAVTETNGLTAVQTTGKLIVNDPDANQSSWQAVNDKAGKYGHLTLDAQGNWVYKLDYQNATVVALPQGGKLTDTVTVLTADGTSKDIVITINGIDNVTVVDQSVINAKGAVTGVEDTSLTLSWDRFGVTGINGVGTLGIKVTSLPADGVLQLNGSAVKAGDTITKADIDAGKLTFKPDANESGIEAFNAPGVGNEKNDYAQFKFQGTDGTSTSAERTLTVDIKPVTDAPTWGGVNQKVTLQTVQTGPALNYSEDFQDGLAQGWTASNSKTGATGAVEIGPENVYGGATSTNLALEVEADTGIDTLGRTFTTQKGVGYTFDFDYMARAGYTGGTNSQISVLVNGVVVKVVNTQSTSWSHQQFTFVGTGSDKIEFHSADANRLGGLIDNLKLVGGGASTVASTDVTIVSDGSTANPVALTTVVNQTLKPPVGAVNFTDNDGSETHLVVLKGVPAGFAVSDGTHTLTSTGGDITVFDAKAAATANWALDKLAVTPTTGYVGTITPVLHATSQDVGDVVKSADFNISLTWTPLPANNPAIVTGDTSSAVTENNGTGTVTTTGTLVVSDPDAGQSAPKAGTYTGTYGKVVLGADGKWTYTLNQTPDIISLTTGQTKTDKVTVQTVDGTTQVITITINGLNQPVTINTVAGDVQEDTKLSYAATTAATGQLAGTDEAGKAISFDAKVYAGTYGSLTVNSNGTWNYALNNSATNVQALKTGDTVPDKFTVTAAGGRTTTVDIAVKGLNDAPVVTGATQGAVTENNGTGTVTTTGTLLVNDKDAGQSGTLAGDYTGKYGKIALDASGHWTYTLNQTPDIIALLNGQKTTDTVKVKTADGTEVPITITINGKSQGVELNSGSADFKEDVAPYTQSGKLVGTDANAQAQVFPATDKTSEYGHFTLAADGTWKYELNNASAKVQQLAAGDVVTEKFDITTATGDKTTVSITIQGTNDVPQITGDDKATVTENNGTGLVTAAGKLTVVDVDHDQSSVAAGSYNGKYGQVVLQADGTWKYTLTQSPEIIALLNGQSKTDTITVRTADGTPKDIVVTINGTSGTATVTSGVASFKEDVAPYTQSGELTGKDANGQPEVFPAINKSDAYGTFTLSSDGKWTYTLNNASSDVQKLTEGEKITQTYDITTATGEKTTMTINIVGTNDAPTVTGSTAGVVTETNGKSTVTTSGTLVVSDPDAGQSGTLAGDYSGKYGKITLDAAGHWTYTLNQTPEVIALLNGQKATDTVTVKTADGTNVPVTITINGTSQAVVLNSGSASFKEDVAPYTQNGKLVGTDANAQAEVFTPADKTSAYGHFTLAADGTWNYVLDNGSAKVQQLAAGDVVTEKFDITTTAGDKTTVTIVINGTNDVPVISGTQTATVTENNGTGVVKSVEGTLVVTDVDHDQSSVHAGTYNGTYGQVTIDAAGHWTYTLTQTPEIIALVANSPAKTDIVKVTTADGTEVPLTITIKGADPAAGSVAGVVWNDENADKSRGSSEAGVGGVEIALHNAAGAVVATTTTAADGSYTFQNVPVGSGYTVDVKTGAEGSAVLNNYHFTTQVTAAGVGPAFAVVGGQTATQNVGVQADAASVKGHVWNDANGNGLLDTGEKGIAGVTVDLRIAGSSTSVGQVTTDANGDYVFNDVRPGRYFVDFAEDSASLSGLVATAAKVGSNPAIDSNIINAGGWTDNFTLGAGQSLTDLDGGFKGALASISNAQVTEGQSLVFNVSLSSLPAAASFDFNVKGVTATSGADFSTNYAFTNGVTYDATAGKITIPAGVTGFTVTVPTVDDQIIEPTETLEVTLGSLKATGTILDNDGTQGVTGVTPGGTDGNGAIIPAQVVEGNPLAFTVELNKASSTVTTHSISLQGVTATEGLDYTKSYAFTNGVTYDATSGKISVPAGVTKFTVLVPTIDDKIIEPTETVKLTVGGKEAVGSILDNDGVQAISAITPSQVTEGQNLSFAVTLNAASSSATTYDLSLAGVTATKGVDFSTAVTFTGGVTYDAATGKVTVPAGVTSFNVLVPTIDDTLKESTETLTLTLGGKNATGTILDNDGAAIPTAIIGSVDEASFSGITSGQTTTTGSEGTIDNPFGDLGNLFNNPGQASGQLPVDTTVKGVSPSTTFDPQASNGFVKNSEGNWTDLGTYGKLTVAADGHWTYTLDQNLTATQALTTGQVVTDSFVVRDGNGNDRTVQVEVHGTNDVPMGNNDFALLQGAGGTVPKAGMSVSGNVLTNDFDYDKGDTLHVNGIKNTQLVQGQVGQELQGAFGHLVIAADGSYTYTLDRQPSIDAKGVASTPETFTYTVTDGHVGADGKPVQTDVQLIIHFDDTKNFTVVQDAQLGDQTLYASQQIHNVFQWSLSDLDTAAVQGDPLFAYTDKVVGFQAQAANGKAADVLDLADLLPSDQAQLDKYLNFSVDAAGNTTVHISKDGAYTTQGLDAAHTNQNIVLEGVNLFTMHGLTAGTTGAEQALIQEMLKDGSLKI
ncbi:VCBS domain-containing protein, partial [Amphibiibacter pelophylacis]